MTMHAFTWLIWLRLGPFIVRANAAAHGGTVAVTSTAEGGTTFAFEFPAEE
jgi:signal transduction histidine kinase